MSDPMTNIDTDDVLASIRRLVAETHGQTDPGHAAAMRQARREQTPAENRSMPRPDVLALLQEAMTGSKEITPETTPEQASDMAQQHSVQVEALGQEKDAPAEALVLTPNFRVVQPGSPKRDGPERDGPAEAAASQAKPGRATAEPERAMPLVLSPELVVHLPETDLAETGAGSAPAAETPAETPFELGAELRADGPQEVAAAPTDGWNPELDDTPAEEAAAHAARLTLEQRIAELEAAVGAQGMTDWEPDGSEDLEAEIPRAMPRAFTETGARVLHFRTRDESEAAMTQDADDSAGDRKDHIDDAEVIEEIPAQAAEPATEQSDALGAVAVDDPASETDEIPGAEEIADAELADLEEQAFSEAYSETVEDLGAEAEVAHDPDPSLEEELALAGYADEDIMDEDALRDLVAQVIREELQGELGERITRNLRRLVRREVQRALTLREFE
ncbi:hypothetical protein [Celeribacter neptunius]|uniref:Uncharacterized protein n=1 Tax=Celeribacter neptunius TaxID=588602 RepID=A0A1I3PI83_9RHOB|nr:hypothetical protein [Celeribacter neptunius]SFJ21245.1 hypothetical protein SAMN04487991_1690 [Celeribacter neptunius]